MMLFETPLTCLADLKLLSRVKSLLSAVFLANLLDGLLFIGQAIKPFDEAMGQLTLLRLISVPILRGYVLRTSCVE